MAQPEFGETVDIVPALRHLLKVSPKLCATDARLVLLEMYEQEYGIYNHALGDPNRPLASVAMHPAENVLEGSFLDERIEQFADKEVTKHFGLSLIEFLDLPTDVCFKILEVAAKRQKVEGSTAASLLNQLDQTRKDL